jgi:hypothetical protein
MSSAFSALIDSVQQDRIPRDLCGLTQFPNESSGGIKGAGLFSVRHDEFVSNERNQHGCIPSMQSPVFIAIFIREKMSFFCPE